MLKEAPHEIAPADGLSIERPAYEARSEAGPRSIGHAYFASSFSLLPASTSSVLLVVDESGYLTPLLTARDLLTLCKAKWRGEKD